MRLIILACVALSGCATADRQAVLQNLQGCERSYEGIVSGGVVAPGFSGAVKIHCAAVVEPVQ